MVKSRLRNVDEMRELSTPASAVHALRGGRCIKYKVHALRGGRCMKCKVLSMRRKMGGALSCEYLCLLYVILYTLL